MTGTCGPLVCPYQFHNPLIELAVDPQENYWVYRILKNFSGRDLPEDDYNNLSGFAILSGLGSLSGLGILSGFDILSGLRILPGFANFCGLSILSELAS